MMSASPRTRSHTRWILPVCVGASIFVWAASPVHGVTFGQSIDDLPWYDAESATLAPAAKYPGSPVTPPLVEPKSPTEWTWEPPDFSKSNNWNFTGIGDGFSTVIQIIAWGALAAILLWFIIFALRSYRELELGQGPRSDKKDRQREVDVEKLADLPFDAPAAKGDLLAMIRHKYENGEFGDAIVLLFGYQLLKLDKTQFIRILKGKTNRQYLRELRRSSHPEQLDEMLSRTMVTFEDYFFGDHPITRERFEACYGQLDDFHSIVEAAA